MIRIRSAFGLVGSQRVQSIGSISRGWSVKVGRRRFDPWWRDFFGLAKQSQRQ